MDKSQALQKLAQKKEEIEKLKKIQKNSPEFKKWHRDTEVCIEKIFGDNGRHLSDFSGVDYNLRAFSSTTPDSRFEQAYQTGLQNAEVILDSFIDEIRDYWEEDAVGNHLSRKGDTSALEKVEKIISRFHLVVRQIRARHKNRETLEIADEYDVQDLLHALLKIEFDDIRPEEWTPSYAGSSSRMDFLLKEEKIVIETKKSRKGLGKREIGEQLIVDIQKYKSHPECRTLLCFVYDPDGLVNNPRGLENDLNEKGGKLEVRVIIAP